MLSSHLSEEDLLTLRHGSEPWWTKWRAQAHLRSCAACRRRRDSLECLARNWLDRCDRDLDGLDVEAARSRFLERVAQPVPELVLKISPVKPVRLPLIAAGTCIAVAAAVGVWTKTRTPAVVPPHPAVVKPAKPLPVLAPRAAAPIRLVRPPASPARALSLEKPPVLDTEIAILSIVHREGICLRGSVEVLRDPEGKLLVRGVLESLEERSALESQIRTIIPGVPVSLDLHVVGEIISTTVPESVAVDKVVAPNRLPPGQELLRAYLVTEAIPAGRLDAEVNRIANESVRLSSALWAEAWALRRLERQFSASDLAALRPVSRGDFHQMAANHLSALTTKLEEIRSLLGGAVAGSRPPPREAASSHGLQEVSQFASSIQDCFANVAEPALGVSSCRSKLHDLLDQSSAALALLRSRADLAANSNHAF